MPAERPRRQRRPPDAEPVDRFNAFYDLPGSPQHQETSESPRPILDYSLAGAGEVRQPAVNDGNGGGGDVRSETGKSKWAERVGRGGQTGAISLAELDDAERAADRLQAEGVALVRRTLSSLAGRRAGSPAEGKDVADRVRELAKRFGVRLHYDGRPVYFKWVKTVFMATTPDASHQHVASGAEFLPLAVPELAAEQVTPSPAGGERSP